jgi:hypothetical protein
MWECAGRVPSLRVFCPGICLTTEGKARKNHSQGERNFSQVTKNLSPSTVYILPRHPRITKPTQTHTLQNRSFELFNYAYSLNIRSILKCTWRLRSYRAVNTVHFSYKCGCTCYQVLVVVCLSQCSEQCGHDNIRVCSQTTRLTTQIILIDSFNTVTLAKLK